MSCESHLWLKICLITTWAYIGGKSVIARFSCFIYDPLHTSDHGSGAGYLRSNYVQITSCGFWTENEIRSERCIWHPIKAHLRLKTRRIDINHFHQTLFILRWKSLTIETHKWHPIADYQRSRNKNPPVNKNPPLDKGVRRNLRKKFYTHFI